MKFDLNDLRKLVKEEMNRRAILKEGVYGGPHSTGLEVMPPEVTKNLPNPDSKASQERKLQQRLQREEEELEEFRKSLEGAFNLEGLKFPSKKEKLKFQITKFINKLAYDLAGIDLVFKENVEPSVFSDILDFLSETEKRQLFMYIYHHILPMLETNEDLNVLDLVMNKISKLNPSLANKLGDFVRDRDGKPRR